MKKVKVSKKGVRKIVAAVAALLAVVVLCYEIGNFNSSNVKTQPAAATTYRNSITVKMFAVRDESLINGSSSLTYVPIFSEKSILPFISICFAVILSLKFSALPSSAEILSDRLTIPAIMFHPPTGMRIR